MGYVNGDTKFHIPSTTPSTSCSATSSTIPTSFERDINNYIEFEPGIKFDIYFGSEPCNDLFVIEFQLGDINKFIFEFWC